MKVPGTFTTSLVTVEELNSLGHVFTSAARPSGAEVYEGRRIYETNTSMWQSYDGSAWTATGPVDGALTDWSGSISIDKSGGTNNVGRSATLATYSRVGRQVTGMFRVVFNAAGTGSSILASLPVAASATSDITAIGAAVFVTSIADYQPLTAVIGVTADRMQFIPGDTISTTYYARNIASGEILTCAFSYEAAS